jgi:DNA-binding IclR family transcriptional regulator
MAFSSDVFVDSALSGVLPRFTPNTLTSKQEIIDSLREVRTTGLAYDNEEYNIGIYCIGAPVFDVNGQPVAGIGISGFSSRFNPENKSKFEKLVLVCAGDISRDIGYTGNFYDNILKDCDHEQR